MRTLSYLLPAVLLGAAGPAWANDIVVKPLVEARIRYEGVDQESLPIDHSDAVTLRVRGGFTATTGRWSALFEAQSNVAIVDEYYDGLHGPANRPLVADPANVAIYRAQLQYKAPSLMVTAGRQRISLDDDRFVDAAPIRQNAITYDALRAEWTGVRNLRADVTYAWGVRTVWGTDGTGARQRAVSGDNVFAELGYITPLGTLTGYAYLVDQDEAAVQGYRLSSQTYGVRLKGSRALGKAKLGYHLSYATQSDYHRNPNDYSADFYLAEGTLELASVKLGAGYEVSGADDGRPFTSFQFPLGSGIRYRGWAGKYSPIPPDGLQDLYGSIGWGTRRLGPLADVAVQAVYHRHRSDRLSRYYGDEIDLLAGGKVGKYALSVRYANYDADTFATDTTKLWLQADWTF